MTAKRLTLDLLLIYHGMSATQRRPPLLQELDKCKIETLLKYVFILIYEVIIYTRSLDKKMTCF